MSERVMRSHGRRLTGRFQATTAGVALLAALWLAMSCGSAPGATIRVGITRSEVNALILIAQDRGYFSDHHVQVSQQIYPSGVAAIGGLFADEVDVATGSEFAFVGQVLAGRDIRALAVVNRSSIEYLVGRLDRGIQSVDDLQGKTIGVPLGSRPEFALDRFLYFRGIDRSEVTLVDVPVNRSAEALAGGEVDAVATWQPHVDETRERMGTGVLTWSVQEDQPSYNLVMSRGQWAAGQGEPIARFLAALVEAEKWMTSDPEAARAYIEEKWDYDAAYVSSVWADHSFVVLLDQTLIVAMEDQARWIIERELAGRAETPNFVDYIYFDGLEAAKPEAVRVIR